VSECGERELREAGRREEGSMGGRQRPTGDCGRQEGSTGQSGAHPRSTEVMTETSSTRSGLSGLARAWRRRRRRVEAETGEAGRSREERVEARSRAWRCERHLEDVAGEGHAAVLALLRKNRLDEVELARRLRHTARAR